jgi:DnaK suppressor protein
MTRGKTTSQTTTNRERHRILKAMLEARRDEIHSKLRARRETLPAEVAEVKDPEEQSVHDFVQDVELALMEMKSETLAKIDEAMIRLEHGSYGTCAECGQEIAEARLQAVPFAVLCRDCQQREEDVRQEENRSDRSFFKEITPPVSR